MDNSQNWENKMNFSTKLQLYKTKKILFCTDLIETIDQIIWILQRVI